MQKLGIAFVALLALTLGVFGLFRGSASMAQGHGEAVRRNWEYKRITSSGPSFPLNTDDFNRLGEQGWELCSSTTTPGGMYFFFKRPKP